LANSNIQTKKEEYQDNNMSHVLFYHSTKITG
jgi:hypothetical protein